MKINRKKRKLLAKLNAETNKAIMYLMDCHEHAMSVFPKLIQNTKT